MLNQVIIQASPLINKLLTWQLNYLEYPLLNFAPIRSLRDKGFFYLLSASFLAQLLGFGTSLVITKFLAPVELGESKILQSYIILFLVFAGSGFNSTVLKYCSENRSQPEREYLLRFSFFRTLGTTAVAIFVMTLLALMGVITGSRDLVKWLLIYGIAVPFIVIADILTVYLQAQKKIKNMSQVQAINKAIGFVVVVISTWRWGLGGFVVGTVVASIISVIPPLLKVGVHFLRASPSLIPAGIYSLALFSVLASGVTILGQYGDVFILDHFVSNRTTIGYYSLATYFILAATQVTITIQAILIPYFSEHWKDKGWFDKNLRQDQISTIILSLLVAAGVYGVAWVLIKYIYGASYQPALAYLSILLIRYIIFSSYAIIAAALIGLGLVKFNFYAAAIVTPIGLVFSYLMQRNYGAMGVAWAQVGAALLILGIELFWLQYARKNHFKTYPLPTN